jgi:hypothetical protein
MNRVIKFLVHLTVRQKLPLIPRTWSVDFKPEELGEDGETLMRLSAIRSPHGLALLQRRLNVETSRELVERLPIPRPRRSNRVPSIVYHVFGTTPYDPMKKFRVKKNRRRWY